jgi:hypothetical protein
MRLQHATEKRNRFKNSGSYDYRLGIWPGKNSFPEKPVIFDIHRFMIRYPLVDVIRKTILKLFHEIITDRYELDKVNIGMATYRRTACSRSRRMPDIFLNVFGVI